MRKKEFPHRDKCPSFPILKETLKKTKNKKKDLLIKLSEKKEGWSWWEKKGFKKVLEPLFQHLSFVNYPRNKGFLFLFLNSAKCTLVASQYSPLHFSFRWGFLWWLSILFSFILIDLHLSLFRLQRNAASDVYWIVYHLLFWDEPRFCIFVCFVFPVAFSVCSCCISVQFIISLWSNKIKYQFAKFLLVCQYFIFSSVPYIFIFINLSLWSLCTTQRQIHINYGVH